MSRKIIIIIIVILILLVVGLFGSAYFISRDSAETTGEVLRDFLPFGESSQDIQLADRSPSQSGGFEELKTQQPSFSSSLQLQQIVSSPIGGATVFEPIKGESNVRYIERSTGNVFHINPKTGKTQRRSNTTIPGIQEVVWGRDGKFILRYLDENDVIKSFATSIDETSTGTQSLTGTFLTNDIPFITTSPDNSKIFYLENFGELALGITAQFDGKNKKQIFESTFTEWLPTWSTDREILLNTKPSGFNIDGFVYSLNTISGTLQKTLGPVLGLISKSSPFGQYILYTKNSEDGPETFVYNAKRKNSVQFPITTLPEKCVWSKRQEGIIYCGAPEFFPDEVLPDAWYQGIVSFSDNLWMINVNQGFAEFLAAPLELSQQEIDIIDPFLGINEEYLFFTNKKDSTLWSLKLK